MNPSNDLFFIQGVGSTIEKRVVEDGSVCAAEEVRASATRDTHRQRLEDWTSRRPVHAALTEIWWCFSQDSRAVSDVEVHQTFFTGVLELQHVELVA